MAPGVDVHHGVATVARCVQLHSELQGPPCHRRPVVALLCVARAVVVLMALRLLRRGSVPLLRHTPEEQNAPRRVLRARVDVCVHAAQVLPERLPCEALRLLLHGVPCVGVHPMHVLPARLATQCDQLTPSRVHQCCQGRRRQHRCGRGRLLSHHAPALRSCEEERHECGGCTPTTEARRAWKDTAAVQGTPRGRHARGVVRPEGVLADS